MLDVAGNLEIDFDGSHGRLVADRQQLVLDLDQPTALTAILDLRSLRDLAAGLARAGLTLGDMSVIELNEAFAAQSLACLRELGIADDDPRVNPNGGAIALGHPLGMSGARLLLTAMRELEEKGGQYALCTMCVGVGQGMATIIERV